MHFIAKVYRVVSMVEVKIDANSESEAHDKALEASKSPTAVWKVPDRNPIVSIESESVIRKSESAKESTAPVEPVAKKKFFGR